MKKTDAEIERDVKDELKWSPGLDSDDIAVSVKNGVVTLTGFTHSYADKFDAERAAKRVAGVVGLANDIEVRLRATDERPDPEITREAVAAIKSQLPLSYERIKVICKNGWIALEGSVEWQSQKAAAERAVRNLTGVKGVSNMIAVSPQVLPQEIKRKIQEALKRNAEIDASRITVDARGGEVILKGTVRSWVEREEAERAAWAAPGVTRVEDHISVGL
jgi:osmotically-inducible protein OsmY